MTKSQIVELREWANKHPHILKGETGFYDILSRLEAEQGEGLRTCKYSGPKDEPCNCRPYHCTADGKPLKNIHPAPDKAVEQEDKK